MTGHDEDLAFRRVLSAEAQARQALAAATEEAQAQAERARAEARRLDEHARQRALQLRERVQRRLRSELQALAEQRAALAAPQPLTPEDHERVRRAVARLVERWTGGAP